jgi:hypothetical protein
VAADSGPPGRTCVIHHRTDELLVEQHTISDGQAASPVKEGDKHAQSLSRLLSHLVDVRRPSKLNIKGHPKIPCCFDLLSPSNCTALGFWICLAALTKSALLLQVQNQTDYKEVILLIISQLELLTENLDQYFPSL